LVEDDVGEETKLRPALQSSRVLSLRRLGPGLLQSLAQSPIGSPGTLVAASRPSGKNLGMIERGVERGVAD